MLLLDEVAPRWNARLLIDITEASTRERKTGEIALVILHTVYSVHCTLAFMRVCILYNVYLCVSVY